MLGLVSKHPERVSWRAERHKQQLLWGIMSDLAQCTRKQDKMVMFFQPDCSWETWVVLWVAEGTDGQEQMWAAPRRAAGRTDEGQELPSPPALHQRLQLGLSLVREKRQDCATGKCI